MTEYNSVNVNLSDSQFSNKNSTEVYLSLSSNMIGHANDETNFSHKLLLISRQVRSFGEAFGNSLSFSLVLSKTQTLEVLQSVGFLGSFLETSLMKVALVLMKNMHQPLAKIVFMSSGLTAATSAADVGFYKRKSWFGFF